MEGNVRYGVVNDLLREAYEKNFQVSYGYEFISRNKRESIIECKKRGDGYIVEKIYDDTNSNNNKVEIFRGGDDEENSGSFERGN